MNVGETGFSRSIPLQQQQARWRCGSGPRGRVTALAAVLAALCAAAPTARAGVGLGPDFVVPDPNLLADDQVEAAMAMDPNTLFVSWVDVNRPGVDPNDMNLWIRVFLPTGLAFGSSGLAGAETSGQARTPHLAVFSGGKVLLTWQDAAAGRAMVRLFNADLLGSPPFIGEIPISGTGGIASKPRAAVRDTGNLAVVAWLEGAAVKFNRLDIGQGTALTARLDGTNGADASLPGTPGEPDVAGGGAGVFVLAYRTNSSGQRIQAKRFDTTGAANGTVLDVATGSVVSASSRARIASLGSSRFVVVWNGPGAGGADDVYGQLIVLGGTGLSLVGSRFTVNTLTAGTQTAPGVTSPSSRDPNTPDRFVVTWQDCIGGASCSDFSADPVGFDGDRSGIAGQVFQVSGGAAQKMGTFFAVNTTVEGRQQAAAAAMDSAGKWAAAWEDLDGADGDGSGVLARRFDATNTSLLDQKLFEGNVNQDGNSPPNPADGYGMDSDDNGVVTVVWQDDNGGADTNIYLARLAPDGRRLPVNGSSLEIQVNDTTAGEDHFRPQVAVEPSSGRGVVAWVHQTSAGVDGDVRYRQFSLSSGNVMLGTEKVVSGALVLASSISSRLGVVGVAANRSSAWTTTGRFAVVWEGKEVAGSQTDIFARVYKGDDTAPNPDPGLILVNNLTTAGNQQNPSLTMSASGTFVVAFQAQDGLPGTIGARRFNANGAALASEFRVDTRSYQQLELPHVCGNAAGDLAVVWDGALMGSSFLQVFGRRYDSNGLALDPMETQLSTLAVGLGNSSCAMAIGGEFVASWNATIPKQGYYRRFTSTGSAKDVSEVSFYTDQVLNHLTPAVQATSSGDVIILNNGVISTAQGGTSSSNENNDLVMTRLTPEPPTGSFAFTLPTCSGSVTSFSDQSVADYITLPTSWKWDLHYNGSTFDSEATVQDPVVVYPNTSTSVDVLLRVADGRSDRENRLLADDRFDGSVA